MKKKIRDERVEMQNLKIESEALRIVLIILLGSVLVKSWFLGMEFHEFAVEFLAGVVVLLFIVVRLWIKGIDLYNPQGSYLRTSKQIIIGSIAVGIIVTILNGISNYFKYKAFYDKDGIGFFMAVLLVTFISATLFALVVLELLGKANRTRQKQIQNKLDEEEDQTGE